MGPWHRGLRWVCAGEELQVGWVFTTRAEVVGSSLSSARMTLLCSRAQGLEVQVEGVGKGGCPLKAQNLGLSLRVSRFFFATPALVQKEVEQKRQIIKLVCCPLAVHPLTAP